MNAKSVLAAASLLLAACVEVPDQPLGAGPGAQGGPPPAQVGPGGPGGPGGAEGPKPPAGSGRMQPKGFEVEEGQGVTISGTVAYEGETEGTLRVDFLPAKPDQGLPGAVHSLTLEAPGPWSVEAPQGFGELLICAFIDTNEDGPSRGEPKVLLTEPITIGTEPIADVQLVVQDDWDRQQGQGGPKQMPPELRADGKTPPAEGPPPPPEGAQAPPEGAPAPDEAAAE